jgi:hypothetical protein
MTSVSESGNNRAKTLVASVCCAAIAFQFYVFLNARDTLANINSDGAVYVLQADVFSPWQGNSFPATAHLFETYAFPPLYPMLLGLFGGGTANPAQNYLVGAACLAVAVGFVCAWLCRRRVPLVGAVSIALLTMATPAAIFIAMDIASEP